MDSNQKVNTMNGFDKINWSNALIGAMVAKPVMVGYRKTKVFKIIIFF